MKSFSDSLYLFASVKLWSTSKSKSGADTLTCRYWQVSCSQYTWEGYHTLCLKWIPTIAL